MKIIMFLLFPLLSIAQTYMPDKLILYTGDSIDCLITNFNDSKIFFDYSTGYSDLVAKQAVEEIYLENFGTVYQMSSGFLADEDDLLDFIKERHNNIKLHDKIKEQIRRIKLIQTAETDSSLVNNPIDLLSAYSEDYKEMKKWSFGMQILPYDSRNIIYVDGINDYSIGIRTVKYNADKINFTANLSYLITHNISLLFETNYYSTHSEDSYEMHQRNYNYENDYGTTYKYGLKIFDLSLGVKYYFTDLNDDNVNLYTVFSVGKQFAFVQNVRKDLLYEPAPSQQIDNNIEDFTEQLNSPFHFKLGFGVDYFINNYLSIGSSIKLNYSQFDGTYKARNITDDFNNSSMRKYSFEEFSTIIGLGVSFYF
jgi:hypothetical protein